MGTHLTAINAIHFSHLLLDKRLGAALIQSYIEDQTKEEEILKFKQYQLAQKAYRETDGKPTKKDRRELDKFMEDWEDED